MTEGEERWTPAAAHKRARDFFEELWAGGDPWKLDEAPLDQARFARQLDLVADRSYRRVLEIGCGAGAFTQSLLRLAEHVLALDVAPSAIGMAEERGLDPSAVEFRAVNVMELDPVAEGPFDLVVMTETIYYLGWLYPMFDLAWLAAQLFEATEAGGRLLLANSYGGQDDWLQRPWLLHTYRDLFLNVGYRPEEEESMRGEKDGQPIEVLISLLERER